MAWGRGWQWGLGAEEPTAEEPPREGSTQATGLATTLTFAARADARVEAAAPTSNFGSSSLLGADLSPRVESYLRFELSGVSGTVTRAILRLYASDGTSDGPRVYLSEGGWTEDGLTWNNRPPLLPGALEDGFAAVGRFGGAVFSENEGFALARNSADGLPLWTRVVATLGAGSLPPVPVGAAGRGFFIARFSPTGETVWSRGFVATDASGAPGRGPGRLHRRSRGHLHLRAGEDLWGGINEFTVCPARGAHPHGRMLPWARWPPVLRVTVISVAGMSSADVELFTPVRLGALTLPHRVVMAPMTRSRAGSGNVPTELMARYYTQRASAGLIITEGAQVAPEGQGYPDTPGIHNEAQVEGWRRVSDAVHASGGRVVLQLWHVGRASHPAYQPGGALPIAPSAIALPGTQVRLPDGSRAPWPTPRALETEEIPQVVERFRRAAVNAKAAGFDGVEIHGANGYLIEQFLFDGTNHRADRYGGPVPHRARFLLEVVEAVAGVWGADRVGVRLSPRGVFNGMFDSDRRALYGYVAEQLERFSLAYLHLIDPVPGHRMLGPEAQVGPNPVPLIRQRFSGPVILNGGYDLESSRAALESGAAAISFGLAFLANPDLPERLRRGAPLNAPDLTTYYGGGERGYTDYPTLMEEEARGPTSLQSTRCTA